MSSATGLDMDLAVYLHPVWTREKNLSLREKEERNRGQFSTSGYSTENEESSAWFWRPDEMTGSLVYSERLHKTGKERRN